MKLEQKFIVAGKDDVFDALFRQTVMRAKFSEGSSAEAAYEAEDAEVNRRLLEIGPRIFSEAFAARHISVGDDWWPDHTRHIDASIEGFTQPFYDGIRSVLSNAGIGWRVQVVVYGDITDGKTMVGSAAIWADRVLIDRALYGLVVWRQIDLRCGSEPTWRQTAAE